MSVTYIDDTSGSCSHLDGSLQCDAFRGGRFAKADSTSWHDAVNFADLHTIGGPDIERNCTTYGNDTLQINSSFSVTEFPFGLVETTFMNQLGLGLGSILLHSLVSAGSITSHVWGYFHGLTGAEMTDQLDGSLLLGGYDEAKTTGNNLTLPFNYNYHCPHGLVVNVSGITMNLSNGSNISIMGLSNGAAFESCIKPDNYFLGLTQDTWASFVKVSEVTEIGCTRGLNPYGSLISAIGSYVS